MRKHLLRTLAAASFATLTSASLLALAEPASAQPSSGREMALGATTAAPPGYLDFCVRTPAQCGLEGLTDADGQPLAQDALRRKLFSQFYWASAFGFAAPAAGGDMAAHAEHTQISGRRTNWNAIFGAVRIETPKAVATPNQDQAAESPIKTAPDAAASSPAAQAQVPLAASQSTQFFAVRDNDWLFKSDAETPAYDRAAYSIALSRSLSAPGAVSAPASAPAAAQLAAAWAAEAPAYAAPAPAPTPRSLAQAAALRAAAEAAEAPAYAAQGQRVAAPQVQAAAFDQTAPNGATIDQPAYDQAPASLAMSRELMGELDRVNQSVNRAIRYVSDKQLYGNEDYWHLSLDPGGPRAGDCKDYVLEKRRALIGDGIPAAALSIAIVQTPWRETHAILLVKTDQGELVLDSLSSWVQPWWKVNYHWIERQAPGQQLTWVAIS